MLPAKGPENNHRADGASLQYKSYRSLQNSIAHVLRILEAYYVAGHQAEGEKSSVLFQQCWQLVLTVFEKISALRRERTVPGAVATHQEVLFGKEEVSQVAFQQKIHAAKGRKRYEFRRRCRFSYLL